MTPPVPDHQHLEPTLLDHHHGLHHKAPIILQT